MKKLIVLILLLGLFGTTAAAPHPQAVEPNDASDSCTNPTALTLEQEVSDTIDPATDEDWYGFDVTVAGSSFRITLTHAQIRNFEVQVYEGCDDGAPDIFDKQGSDPTDPKDALVARIDLGNYTGPVRVLVVSRTASSKPYTLLVDAPADFKSWSLTGNAGTNPSNNFLGTTDDKAFEIRVNNQRALRVEPATVDGFGFSPNLIGGSSSNNVTDGVVGATISGGGLTAMPNRVTDYVGTVGGGMRNQAGNGNDNVLDAISATVGGGSGNTSSSTGATIGGGGDNYADGDYATVGGGSGNTSSSTGATIGGGSSNYADSDWATIGGGSGNQARGDYSTIGGGNNNRASERYATVGGGWDNTATGWATVAGGIHNSASDTYTTVGGGIHNTAEYFADSVGGGYENTASGPYATVGGGEKNTADITHATVAGGLENTATGWWAAIGGGRGNTATRAGGVVGGGENNTASEAYATVPGGLHNTAKGKYSFATGYRAKANHQGSFVWADSTDSDFTSERNDQFRVRANGGVRFDVNNNRWVDIRDDGTHLINTSTGAHLTTGGAWTNASDRNAKENFEPVEGREVLDHLAKVPISTWNYKAENSSIRHMGPTAQEFYAAFGLGDSDTSIGTVDSDGVALAAIQGLYDLLKQQEAIITAQQQQIEALQAANATLKAQNATWQEQLAALEARLSALEHQSR